MRTSDYIVTRCLTEQMFDGANSKFVIKMIRDMLDDMAFHGGESLRAIIDSIYRAPSICGKIEGFHFFFGEEVYQIFRQRAGELFDIRSLTFMHIPYTVSSIGLMSPMMIKLEYTKPSESYMKKHFIAPSPELMKELSGIKTKDRKFEIKKVVFNDPATIVIWKDGTKTVVKATGEAFDPEKGLAMAISKRALGTNDSGSNYNNIFKKWCKEAKR